MRLPNFIIGGAPKCGTTSLFDWLVAHPDVCGSHAKEPFFLMDKGNPLTRKYLNFQDHGLEAYPKVFPRCTEAHKVVLEASTHYLYQDTAREVIADLPTRPLVLFMLRKPSERVFSSFSYFKNKGNIRKGVTFTDCLSMLAKNPDRSAVSRWAYRTSGFVLPRDIQYSRYADYLSLWRERLGEGRTKIMLFETMRADPQAAVRKLCDWVGIDPAYYDDFDFDPKNRTSVLRSHGLQRVAQLFATPIRSGPAKEAMKRAYYWVQATQQREPRTTADETAIAELDHYFRPYNERLASEFGLDLEAWN